jgi:membrane protease subunit (stomatin/prohibitin family)
MRALGKNKILMTQNQDPSPGTDPHARFLRIQQKLINELMTANYPLPIAPGTKISDLTSNVIPIVRLINETFFPDNRFTTGMIALSDIISNVSLAIFHLDPPNI